MTQNQNFWQISPILSIAGEKWTKHTEVAGYIMRIHHIVNGIDWFTRAHGTTLTLYYLSSAPGLDLR